MPYDPDSFPPGTVIEYCGEPVVIQTVRHDRRQRSILWHGNHIWLLVVTLKLAAAVSNR